MSLKKNNHLYRSLIRIGLVGALTLLAVGLLLASLATARADYPAEHDKAVDQDQAQATSDSAATDPPTLTVAGEPVTFTSGQDPTVIAPDVTVTDALSSTASLYGAKVSILDNFNPDEDRLGISGTTGTSGTVEGIHWNYDPDIGVLELGPGQATDPITKYQKALRQVTYYNLNAIPVTETREVRFQIIEHFYEVVATGKTWPEARAAAASSTYSGLQGYLATVMSADENEFIMTTNYWFGATDAVTEEQWIWASGPESGTHFFQQNPDGSPGEAINGHYENWAGGEPNDYGSGEDYASWQNGNGIWNDWTSDETRPGYVVEYGGMPGDPGVTSGTVPVNIRLENQAPNASASVRPEIVFPGHYGTLNGSASHDPNDNELAFHWEQNGGEAAVIANHALSVTTFTAPSADTVITFTLTVTDIPPGGLTPMTDTTTISVAIANLPPWGPPTLTVAGAVTFTDGLEPVVIAPQPVFRTLRACKCCTGPRVTPKYYLSDLPGPEIPHFGCQNGLSSFSGP